MPLGLAAAIVLLVTAAIVVLGGGNARGKATMRPISAPLDPYASSLSLTGLAMSESRVLSGIYTYTCWDQFGQPHRLQKGAIDKKGSVLWGEDAEGKTVPITDCVPDNVTSVLDGHIANHGGRTVTGITVQVLFRNAAGEVVQNKTRPLSLIRTREPYIDVETVSAAPLKPGDEHDFRIYLPAIPTDWKGAYPEIRILGVETK